MDLAYRGISLGELVRQRRVRYLLNLIDHLPRDSHYQEAKSKDPDLALQIYLDDEHGGRSGPRYPKQSDMSYTNELITVLTNEIKGMRSEILSALGQRAHPDFLQMPRRAIDDVTDRMNRLGVEVLNQMLAPKPKEDNESG